MATNFKRDIYCAETHKVVATVTDSMVFDHLMDADDVFFDGEKWLSDRGVAHLLADITYFSKYVYGEKLVDQIKVDIEKGNENAIYELLALLPKKAIDNYLCTE